MEYMAMLEVPGMVAGLQELISDSDTSVVKRTIRVFTNVYRHSLSLLAAGDLDPIKYEKSYDELSGVSDQLMELLKTVENEGVVVHLVRYLEAALVSHILSDLSRFPHIAKMTAPMLKKCVDALFELVNTPYVGGSAFCVAIRALFTVACYQVDMRAKVTDVAETLINSPPPNLFDHNVRSFHKTLQRNLFRLLKRSKLCAEKERLIDMMVRVGVPRKRLWEWAPRQSKKRPAPVTMDDRIIYGRRSPPLPKKSKLTESEIIRFSHPSAISGTAVMTKVPSIPITKTKSVVVTKLPSESKRKTKHNSNVNATAILDKILSDPKGLDQNSLKSQDLSKNSVSAASLVKLRTDPERPSPLSEVSNLLQDRPPDHQAPVGSKENSPIHTNADSQSPPPPSSDCGSSSTTSSSESTNGSALSGSSSNDMLNRLAKSFDHVFKKASSKSVIKKVKFTDICSHKEKNIYNKLTIETVVNAVLTSVENLPETKPKNFPLIKPEQLDTMKEKLSILLSRYVPEDKSVLTQDSSSESIYESTSTSYLSKSATILSNNAYEKTDSVQNTVLFSSKDVDLRPILMPRSEGHSIGTTCSTDLRTTGEPTNLSIHSKFPHISSSSDVRLQSQQRSSSHNSESLILGRQNHQHSTLQNDQHSGLQNNQFSTLQNSDPRLRNSRSPSSTPPLFSIPPPSMIAPPPSTRDPRLCAQTTSTLPNNNYKFHMNTGPADNAPNPTQAPQTMPAAPARDPRIRGTPNDNFNRWAGPTPSPFNPNNRIRY